MSEQPPENNPRTPNSDEKIQTGGEPGQINRPGTSHVSNINPEEENQLVTVQDNGEAAQDEKPIECNHIQLPD